MQKACKNCGQSFEITDGDLTLLDKLSPVIGDKKYVIPPPTLCFSCRLQRRLAFYNSRALYKDECDLTGKAMVSIFSPEKLFTVYDREVWYGDDWDPMDYGRKFDFSRPFFPQFREFMEAIPQLGRGVISNNVNSDYTNDNVELKNCYLVFDGGQGEDCYYGHTFAYIKDCVDFLCLKECELCYMTVFCEKCYNLAYSRYCYNCSDSWFLRDCIGCKNCFGCVNLRQKQYCIFNEQKSKKEYETFLAEFQSSKYSVVESIRKRAEEFFLSQPVKATRGERNEDVVGDNIYDSKDVYTCFESGDLRDCRYCTVCIMGARDCMDVHIWGDKLELSYDSCVVGLNVRNVMGGYYISEGCDGIYYSMYCSRSSSNLFGCIGLRHKKNCVMNKQYSKEEYEELVPRIIEHMKSHGEYGEFFPIEISMFGYNETMADGYFPLPKEEVLKKGWQWCDYETKVEAQRSIPAAQLPDDTNDVLDDVLNWVIECEETGRPFKIVKQELDFYRQHCLPLPRRHPDQRYRDLFKFRNPFQLWDRECKKCGQAVKTSYSSDRPEIVYCERCYLEMVY